MPARPDRASGLSASNGVKEDTMSLLALPLAETQSPLEPASKSVPYRLAVGLGLVLVVGLFAGRCWDVARRDAITSDETTHLTHSLHYWITGDDLEMWELGAPRLPHLAYGLASYLALRPSGALPAVPDEPALTALVTSGSDRVLLPARSLAILSGVVLLLSVFWAVARTRNAVEALIAVALLSLVPECLAHSAIAGSDMPFTAAAMLAVILLSRFAERPSWSRWLSASAVIGLAWAMRHSAILLLILAAGVHLAGSLRGKSVEDQESEPLLDRLSSSFLAILAMGTLAFSILWGGDGFQTLSMADLAE
ncbi:MAG TPA: glycosyltransferase family 39 protein, partial [Isosphaeraceae bacterium]|nr:glycosyltransferase family 39 protein [Isosphaeraceae bacterium]